MDDYLLTVVMFLIIYLSNAYFLNLDIYYIYDFLASDFHHNENLNKKFLTVIPNYSHIFGASTWIIEPSLNFLSRLNYNLSSKNDYLLYLVILRLLEILLIFALLFLFSTKLKIKDLTQAQIEEIN